MTTGEIVFTTNLTGYQEVFTDPSYLGQIVVMTAPMIGNYGINPEDVESASGEPQVSGVLVRELSRGYSNWRATGSLDGWLAERGIPILEGCLAILECRTQEQLPGGDHTIFIGEVEAVHLGEGEPLVYYRGGYRAASP